MKDILFITFIFFFACNADKQSEQQSTEPEPQIAKPDVESSVETTTEEIIKEPTETKDNELSNRVEFEYIDEPNETKQVLTVSWLSDDSVTFELFTETMLCDYKQHGTAILKQETEVDEDEDGISYLVSEYEVVDAGKLWSLRIQEPERDKAKIVYLYDNPIDECDPFDELMKRATSNKD